MRRFSLSQRGLRIPTRQLWAGRILLVMQLFLVVVSGMTDLPSGDKRCTGISFDLSRLRDYSRAHRQSLQPISVAGPTSYKVNQVFPLKLQDHHVSESGETSSCVVQRLRLTEALNEVPIYGATSVITLDNCYAEISEAASEEQTANLIEEVTSRGFKNLPIRDIQGKTFSNIDVVGGYTASYSADSVIQKLSEQYGLPEKSEKIALPELYIFPTPKVDYLAYFVKMMIPPTASEDEARVFRFIVNAHDLTILSTCLLSNTPEQQTRRKTLRQPQPPREVQDLTDFCESCAEFRPLSITSTITTQEIRSLYLTDAGKNVEVIEATLIDEGITVNVPGAISGTNWLGTFHCFNEDDLGFLVELPTDCQDALSDVHYVSLETLNFLQAQLNVLGGLAVSATSPEPVSARVHYLISQCGTLYFRNEIYFGDCDCVTWTPLVTIDFVAYELGHGVTEYTSGLEYAGQSGGLNEGFSDILGAVMEFWINDSTDTPDFTVGESLLGTRGIFRYMEDPTLDGISIGTVCDYTGQDVHYTSGVLNKAYVSSVRACEAAACSAASESDCALLMGKLFLYANIYQLSPFSTFVDAATATCSVVSEFFTQTTPSETTCSVAEVASFVEIGWFSVDVFVDGSCGAVEVCSGPLDISIGCESATTISVPSTTSGSTINQLTYDSAACGDAKAHPSMGFWYSVIGTGTTLTASLCTPVSPPLMTGDSQLSVWTGGTCNGLVCVDGNDEFCGSLSQVTWPSVLGQEYLIYVYGFFGVTFDYILTLVEEATDAPTPAPGNDIDPSIGCAAAVAKLVPSFTADSTVNLPIYTGTLLGCGDAEPQNSAGVWYTITGTGREIALTTCSYTDFDTQLSVFSGSCTNLVCVNGNDDNCQLRSSVSFPSTLGETYFVYLYGWEGAEGSFQLFISEIDIFPTLAPSPPPAGLSMADGCNNATTLTAGTRVNGTTIGTSVYQTERCVTAYPLQSPGVWYRVQGTGFQIVASLCNNVDFDSMLSIWIGGCDNLMCVVGSDDACDLASFAFWDSSIIETYTIFVHGYAGEVGNFTLSLSDSLPIVPDCCLGGAFGDFIGRRRCPLADPDCDCPGDECCRVCLITGVCCDSSIFGDFLGRQRCQEDDPDCDCPGSECCVVCQ